MPTILPAGRPTITGPGDGDFRQPRATFNAKTRDMPAASALTLGGQSQPSQLKTGQSGITEDTSSQPAVTFSPQMSAMARKQQKLQAEIQAQRDKETEWEKQRGEYVRKPELQAKLKQNAFEALQDAFGVDYEGLTAILLEQQNGADPVKGEINSLKNQVEKLIEDRDQATNKQYDATLKQYKAETASLIEKEPKKFFFINKEEATDQVVQHIVETWEEDPDTVLTVEQAAQEIEEILRDDAKKRKALLEELEKPEETEAAPPQKQRQTLPPPSGARTLTESVAAVPTTRSTNQFQHMSMKERIALAVERAQRG